MSVADMRFDAPNQPSGPRPARPIGPSELGLNSRVDVYLHDGCDENGEEYAARITLAFDETMVERAMEAIAEAFGACSNTTAEAVLRAALGGPRE